ncbi:MAG: PIG-L family deacetylase [Acidimicrobiia bacterium]|nr:PIG-L family deacetylase [Acidimicrobiia bacterium]
MAAAVDAGNRVVCVTATRGEAGSLDLVKWPPETLASVREAELAACLAVLGVREHIWLDYPDGGCADVAAEEATDRVAEIIRDVEPDTVVTFGPDGMTWHADHIAVSEWTSAAFPHAAPDNARLLYATKTPQWADGFLAAIDADQVMMSDQLPPVTPVEDLAVNVRLEGPALDRKYKAMLCQPSQVESLLGAMGEEDYRSFLADESFRLP